MLQSLLCSLTLIWRLNPLFAVGTIYRLRLAFGLLQLLLALLRSSLEVMWLVLLLKLLRLLKFVSFTFWRVPSVVRSHATKEPSLSDDTLYIRTLFMAGKLAIHLTPLLTVSSLSPKVLPFLLQATHSVEVWSFIFSLTFHHFRQVRSKN